MCVCVWLEASEARALLWEKRREGLLIVCVCVCVLTAECLDGHGRMTSRRIQPHTHTHTANQPKLTKQSHTNNEKKSYSWRLFWKKLTLKFFRSKLAFWWLDFFGFSMKIAEHFFLCCGGVDCGLGIYRSEDTIPPLFCNDARRDTRHTPLFLLLFFCLSVFVSLATLKRHPKRYRSSPAFTISGRLKEKRNPEVCGCNWKKNSKIAVCC